MSRFELVAATEEHALDLATRLSEQSIIDCRTLGLDPGPQSVDNFRTSVYVFAGLMDGRCFCMFGVVPDSTSSSSGQAWLLTSSDLKNAKVVFGRASRQYLPFVAANRFAKIYGWVYEKNAVPIKWLRWLGYEIAPTSTPIGCNGELYYYCEWRPS